MAIRSAERVSKRVRRTAIDWQEAMLDALAEEGPAGIDIERLARRLGVTKGSFYWHFVNREELIDAALQRWEQLDSVIAASLNSGSDAHAALRAFFHRTGSADRHHRILAALLQRVDCGVACTVAARVSRRRLKALGRFFHRHGCTSGNALQRAAQAHALCLGLLQAPLHQRLRRMPASRRDAFVDETIRLLLPDSPVGAELAAHRVVPRRSRPTLLS
jgi:AcrR family transcriptional regulator